MASNNSSSSSSGIGLSGVVFCIFLVLKLCEIGPVAKWSWWWVTAPLWIGVLIGLAVFLVWFIIQMIAAYHRKQYRKRYK